MVNQTLQDQTENQTGQVLGFRVAGVSAGLKANGRLDFALIVSDRPCTAAGVFTTNTVKAAPVLVDMEQMQHNAAHIRAVAINTRSANACTGQTGIDNAWETIHEVARAVGCDPSGVLVMSTGVIGLQLPMDKIRNGIKLASQALSDDWPTAAAAIMTTDTRPKFDIQHVQEASGKAYNIAGIAKGAGMIAPNMATMLSVIATDVALPAGLAQQALATAVRQSFNQIIVDGDMSTNDTVVLLANGASGARINTAEELAEFQMILNMLCRKLAKEIVRDGEGATKFVTLQITGAPDNAAARKIADAIATSPLVKTALFGSDANWGRIVAAAGRSGVAVNPNKLRLWVTPGEKLGQRVYPEDSAERHLIAPEKSDALLIFENGTPTDYSEDHAMSIMAESTISFLLDCGMGTGWSEVWTCDLSHDYVSINGDYRS